MFSTTPLDLHVLSLSVELINPDARVTPASSQATIPHTHAHTNTGLYTHTAPLRVSAVQNENRTFCLCRRAQQHFPGMCKSKPLEDTQNDVFRASPGFGC